MRLIDTHAHLYAEQFDKDRAAMIARAREVGVRQFFLPNIDRNSIPGMLELEKKYPGQCFAMMGLHPCSVKEDYEQELAAVRKWLDKRSFAAVGEIGIDLYWDKTFFEQQKDAFLKQVHWAKELDLPIVIHSREATDIIIDLLAALPEGTARGIFHCFGGSPEQARRIIDLGFYLGIGGVVTFKKSGLDKTLAEIDLEHLVLETDAPYLAPTPYRGKRNESAYIYKVAEKIAEIKERELEEVAQITSRNADAIFSLSAAAMKDAE
ncbi:MAG TPA: TatD family hydrolase [Saprospiraceae bacterium]|nr:TatD family hydrolase [Saprospiraceae bacterium]